MLFKMFALLLFKAVALVPPSSLPSAVKGTVVTTPGAPTAEARTFATLKDKLLLADYLEATRPGADYDQMLKTKLERAQRAWLGGDIETARSEFRALTELSLKADWKADQREVIQAAFLRMAQSSESSTERNGWLESALRLYIDIEPDQALFPPPLLTEFAAMKKRMPLTTIEIRDVFPDFRFVLIDGRKIDLTTDSRVQLPLGLHRLTALSDSHESVTEFMTAAQLRVLRLSPPPLSDGVCESAKLRSWSSLPSGTEIYSGAGCSPKLSSVINDARLVSAPREFAASKEPTATVESKDRTWLYVVGGAVLAGAAYAIASHQSQSPEPTHRSGFAK